MVTRAQKIRLGVFLTIGFALLLLIFGLVVGKKLMTRQDVYYISYEDTSVNGLQVGGQVKYHGILIGTVKDIAIDPKDISKVVVSIQVKSGTPIKKDVQATLVMVGITGLKSVELVGGSNMAPKLPPNSYIPAGSTMFDNITGKAEVIAEKIEVILNNLGKITGPDNQEYLSGILQSTNQILDENKDRIGSTVDAADSMMIYLAALSKSSNKAMKELNGILASDQVKTILNNTADFSGDLTQTDQLVADLREVSQRGDVVLKRLDETLKRVNGVLGKSDTDLVAIIESLRETIDYLNDFSRQIDEEPSLLIRAKKK